MGPFVEQASEGAYQWSHFTTMGMGLVMLCLLVSVAVVLFCAVAIRRSQWDDKDAILSVVMAVAGVVSLSIWYVVFGGRLLDYHESNIPTADRVILFSFASLLGSILAAVAGVVMMGIFSSKTDSDSPQRSRPASGGRPQVTQAMTPRGAGPPPSPQNPGMGAASGPAGPAGGSQQGTLIQSSPATPASAPDSQRTMVQGAASPANLGGSGGGLASDRTQIGGSAPGFGAPPPGSPAGDTMAPIAQQPTGVLLHLDVIAGPATGSSYNLQEGNSMLGRSPDSTLFIDDPTVSRAHAMVRVEDGETFLVDLGSRGGTRIGDRQVEGSELGVGETLTVGQTDMTLLSMSGMATPSSGGGETMMGTPGASMVLVAQSGADSGKMFPLREGPNIVGRDIDADIQMSDQHVSRRHAVVTVKEDSVAVSDIGSSYGTTVNGQSLEGTKLNIGDHVFVGQSELVLTGPGV